MQVCLLEVPISVDDQENPSSLGLKLGGMNPDNTKSEPGTISN